MKVSYHGHSVVKIQTDKHTIVIDPFINGNGQTDLKVEDLKVDVILLTHGHNDHVGDTIQLAKQNNALVVAPFELATYLGWKGLNVHPMHIGGSHKFDFGTVKLTQAFHGSSYEEEDQKIIYTGMPAGILFKKDGKTVYHAGDTGLYSDMKLLGEFEDIDLAFLPIGDNFTMGPEDAAIAAKWIKAKTVVPMHYNTFPVIEQDPKDFVSRLTGKTGKVMEAGESIKL
ncbi:MULTISPECIES: metal-dependent hydrolase [Metabacillus]|uniref:Metal-dependent hydrolase n=1 Tax=Metabacillus hrfriensis TaxID=3048891 RepID=A0ACD4R8L2_9BACI|nr:MULTISPECIES: metal-dependent hydrolase [Metabacillus]UAL51297.1 metal-dependent hydrolase [Metabacillus dongyingensis]UOK57239.1 metal-dependent hydrolase [Bacillus sp. OVS6]WHZ56804.1 metal-dependent hydrolase [Metabacillus sp. CT-WN-B3]